MILCASLSTNAQEEKRITASILAGGAVSQVGGDFLQGYRKYGVSAGLSGSIGITSILDLNMDLLYTRRGARAGEIELPYPGRNLDTFNSYQIILPYYELPFYLTLKDKNLSAVGIGFSYCRLSNGKELLDGVDQADTYPFKNQDWNFVGEVRLPIYKKKWIMHCRYNHSLFNIRASMNQLLYHDAVQINKSIALRMMYLL
jgi:hypothetical protein